MALNASGTTAQTKSFELVRVRVHAHWYPTGKTSFESVRVQVRTSTSSAGLSELELGFTYEFSAQIELDLELLTQLRPWARCVRPRVFVDAPPGTAPSKEEPGLGRHGTLRAVDLATIPHLAPGASASIFLRPRGNGGSADAAAAEADPPLLRVAAVVPDGAVACEAERLTFLWRFLNGGASLKPPGDHLERPVKSNGQYAPARAPLRSARMTLTDAAKRAHPGEYYQIGRTSRPGGKGKDFWRGACRRCRRAVSRRCLPASRRRHRRQTVAAAPGARRELGPLPVALGAIGKRCWPSPHPDRGTPPLSRASSPNATRRRSGRYITSCSRPGM